MNEKYTFTTPGPMNESTIYGPAGQWLGQVRGDKAALFAAAPELGAMLLSTISHVCGPARAEAEALLKKAGLLP